MEDRSGARLCYVSSFCHGLRHEARRISQREVMEVVGCMIVEGRGGSGRRKWVKEMAMSVI